MGKGRSGRFTGKSAMHAQQPIVARLVQTRPEKERVNSLLDHMQDGNEYGSLLSLAPDNIDFRDEIRRSISEIEAIRKRPVICYLANMYNARITVSTMIDGTDNLPFAEMVDTIPKSEKAIDIILVTPGGYAEQVSKFVDMLRKNQRFETIGFLIPDMAMSAGTIFCMSADELIMTPRSYIGPIDPQVRTKDGRFVPAQSLLTLIKDIQDRGNIELQAGRNPSWTDRLLINNIDGKELGNVISASQYSTELVTDYLYKYKFKEWTTHASTGQPVTDYDRKIRAREIAAQLCDHSLWKTHSRGITREMASSICRLHIIKSESIEGLDRALRRFWALVYWVFENTTIYKILISSRYSMFRTDVLAQGKKEVPT